MSSHSSLSGAACGADLVGAAFATAAAAGAAFDAVVFGACVAAGGCG